MSTNNLNEHMQQPATVASQHAAFTENALHAVISSDGELFHTKRGKVRPVPLPLAPIAESHGHLFSDMEPSIPVALVRAAFAGVALMVVPLNPADCIHMGAQTMLDQLSSWQEKAQTLLDACIREGAVLPSFQGETPSAELPSHVKIVAGAHPYDSELIDDADALNNLAILLNDERCVGVGEFGLDFGPYNELGLDIQEKAFRTQIRMAHERHLPVQLHLRDAVDDPTFQVHRDALRILEDEGIPEAGCDLHCFTCGPEVMQPFTERRCYIAFGGAATFKRSNDIRAAIAACPNELLLCETDCPYMAPVPLRGKACEPAMIAFNAACIAQVREEVCGTTQAETYAALWNNAHRFFGLE